MANKIRHSIVLGLRVSPEMSAAIDKAATVAGLKSSEWLRQAISAVLSVEGISYRAPVDEAA